MARPPSIDEPALLGQLVSVFRDKGFVGAALTDLTQASGLQRASLYHRYPGGKEQMAEAVLDQVGERFRWILAPLAEDEDVERGVCETADRLGDFYGAGTLACVLESMTLGGAPQSVRDHARSLAQAWIDAMAHASRRAGHSPAEAKRAAREAFLRIEGALVLARVTGDTDAFIETLALLPSLLLPQA
ncbi:TetR/AcrR family transcriptional regulator [Nocardia blacklockiae]|uniref:TetR/AcrR family transcriptional regulator n=1 Tax=Nocardia blacklockiae TaxID=480036 RepID=UPI0018954831|nr:TetR/AcrR family transcriptional regulator [Nocardia blacklockiae]MBF6173939.1 TetR/AcrR family transcriptional regulator [Nocardia blacklockiae]